MEAALWLGVLAALYGLIYYRLMVRFYYQKLTGRPESGFAAVFSFPPYKILPEAGRRYARRYWIALAALAACVALLAHFAEPLF